MTVVGSSVINSNDTVSPQRLFAEFFGNLVEFRRPSRGSAGTWVNHGSPPVPNNCIGLPSVALIDNKNSARQLRVFFPLTNGHLVAARFAAGSGTPVFDDHGTPPGGLLVATSPGALIVEPVPFFINIRRLGGFLLSLPWLTQFTYRMFMGSSAGTLIEHKIVGSAANLVWTDFGNPSAGPGQPVESVLQRPGAPYFAFPNPVATAGLFVTTSQGNVFEFILQGSSAGSWVAHGSPAGVRILSEPSGLITGFGQSVRSFFVGSDSNLYLLTASSTGTAGVWSVHGRPRDSSSTLYDMSTSPGGLAVVPLPGDLFFRFFIVGTSDPVPVGQIIGLPEDRLFRRFGRIASSTFLWEDDGPAAALPLGFNPPENLTTPRSMGQNSNSTVDPLSIFVGTDADRLLEFDLFFSMWTDHGTPPRGTPCGPRRFSVGFGN